MSILCTKKDWNQEDQKVRRSNLQYKKHNNQLDFITNQLEEIEKERNVTESDIDKIVEASIKGVSLQELENTSQLLSTMIESHYNHIKDNPSYSYNTLRKYSSTLSNF